MISVPSSIGAARLDRSHIAGEVLAARLDQRRRADPDQFRLRASLQVEDRLLQMVGAAEDRGDLVHRRGLQRDRLLEVTHEQHQREGRATLAAVEQRHGARDAEIGEGGAERLRGLQRIDRRRLGDWENRSHARPLALAQFVRRGRGELPARQRDCLRRRSRPGARSHRVGASHGAGARACAQTGLWIARSIWRTSSTMPS